MFQSSLIEIDKNRMLKSKYFVSNNKTRMSSIKLFTVTIVLMMVLVEIKAANKNGDTVIIGGEHGCGPQLVLKANGKKSGTMLLMQNCHKKHETEHHYHHHQQHQQHYHHQHQQVHYIPYPIYHHYGQSYGHDNYGGSYGGYQSYSQPEYAYGGVASSMF